MRTTWNVCLTSKKNTKYHCWHWAAGPQSCLVTNFPKSISRYCKSIRITLILLTVITCVRCFYSEHKVQTIILIAWSFFQVQILEKISGQYSFRVNLMTMLNVEYHRRTFCIYIKLTVLSVAQRSIYSRVDNNRDNIYSIQYKVSRILVKRLLFLGSFSALLVNVISDALRIRWCLFYSFLVRLNFY